MKFAGLGRILSIDRVAASMWNTGDGVDDYLRKRTRQRHQVVASVKSERVDLCRSLF